MAVWLASKWFKHRTRTLAILGILSVLSVAFGGWLFITAHYEARRIMAIYFLLYPLLWAVVSIRRVQRWRRLAEGTQEEAGP